MFLFLQFSILNSIYRSEKKLGKVAENSQNSPLFDSVATKRQKLEAGYLGKVHVLTFTYEIQ